LVKWIVTFPALAVSDLVLNINAPLGIAMTERTLDACPEAGATPPDALVLVLVLVELVEGGAGALEDELVGVAAE
jgi:hypothetical protein